ncbi:hypothetical protein ABZS76_33415 [Streptomyces sp. NPDC005562]|uniref:hypothetical protein n=1 Tax=Streptomyces sp. NPDC005562 TaxID=3154890 RepID=UPI0033AA359C
MSLNKDMGDTHEAYFADLLGQRQTRGSGNQWRDPIDARHNRLDTNWAYASDGKSTLKKSISVSLASWKKAVEQAGGERPSMPLRFYADAALTVAADLMLCDLLDFAEMRDAAQKWEQVKPLIASLIQHNPRCIPVLTDGLQRILEDV